MGELLANNGLDKGVGNPIMVITQFFLFCYFSSAYRHLFLCHFSDSLFSNRWILQFDRLGQLKAPQCLVLTATQICCADLIVARSGLRAADQCPGELLGWNIEISSTHKRKNTTSNDRKGTHQLYFHSLCCTQPKKKKKKNWCIQFPTLVILLLTISDFVFSQQTLLHEAFFLDTRWFCLHTQPSVPRQTHFCFTACRQITRGEESRAEPASPTFPQTKH